MSQKPWSYSDEVFAAGVHIVPDFEPKPEPAEPTRLVADPTCVNMLRSTLLAVVAVGLFLWIVVEFCRHI